MCLFCVKQKSRTVTAINAKSMLAEKVESMQGCLRLEITTETTSLLQLRIPSIVNMIAET